MSKENDTNAKTQAVANTALLDKDRRHFMYFQELEGGMSNWDVDDLNEFNCLNGWMRDECILGDTAMLIWIQDAKIGETHEHRMGVLVRLADKSI